MTRTTRNGDTIVTETDDVGEIARMESEPFDDSSNIASTSVTE